MENTEKINVETGEIETGYEEELNELPTEEGQSLDTIIVDYQHVFSDTDLAGMALRMVELDENESVISEEKKAVMSEYTSRLKACEAERKKLCTDYRTGSQMRSIECHPVKDYESQLMLFISTEDCSLIKERSLDPSEQQLNLDDIQDIVDQGSDDTEDNKD